MRITEAIAALIALLQNCELADDADFHQHTYYKTVKFRPEYPLATVDLPVVAFSPAGGTNRAEGLGQWERWHEARLQMDVLAENAQYARRIYEKVREVVMFDYNDSAPAPATQGQYGRLYLHYQGLKRVDIGEGRATVWDEEGRIARVVADVTVEFRD